VRSHLSSNSRYSSIITGQTIVGKHKRAVDGVIESHRYYEALTASAPDGKVSLWETEILKAESERRGNSETMDVMASRVEKGISYSPDAHTPNLHVLKAKSRQEIELLLTTEELEAGVSGQSAWLATGLRLEVEQYVKFFPKYTMLRTV